MVCTGNICRSPMAEGLLKKALADRSLDGVEVRSAGTSALVGRGAEPLARSVMEPFGVELAGHRARMLTRELVRWADRILVMTPSHARAVLELDPEAPDKVRLLGSYGPSGEPEPTIADPFGAPSAGEYRRCAVKLSEAVDGFVRTEAGELAS